MTTHQTPQPPRLRLRLPAGRIEVTTWDEPSTDVVVEPLSNDQACTEAAAAVRQELRSGGDGPELVIETAARRGVFGFRREPELRYTIRAPQGSSIDADTASADVMAAGRFAEVKVETASGDVSVGEVSGSATIKTVSGDVDVIRVGGALRCSTVSGDADLGPVTGEITAASVSGDVRVGAAASSVTAKSVSGDLLLDAVSRGEVKLQSVSGDITVGVVRGARLWMDVASLSGATQSDLEPPEGADGADREIDLRITANSTSGDVRLFRAKQLTSA
jgi:hypothetical protein